MPSDLMSSSAIVNPSLPSGELRPEKVANRDRLSTELNNDFRGKKCTVYKVGYPMESDMPRLDKRFLL